MRRNNLAYREAFLAGRLGIRAKILIYLAVLAGFIISAVWMLQGVLVYGASRGLNVPQQLLDASRTQFWLTVGAILVATALVGFTMARSISEPIIETNEAAKQLSESRYDLQRELIANISHDLRTPLTMIEGYAEAMRDIPEEVTPENMQIIIDETNRLNSMVNEVLDFSRLRTGNLELEEKPFSLTEQIRGIVGRVSKMTAVEGYTVVFDPAEDRTVKGDSARISQVVYNLLGNALTYTGEDKTVRITQQDIGSRVRVEISDSGEGIPKDELPFIFDRYYRSRENHRRAVIGSGLGLNICRSILEKHGARYGVKSEEGQGTTFWFELPRA